MKEYNARLRMILIGSLLKIVLISWFLFYDNNKLLTILSEITNLNFLKGIVPIIPYALTVWILYEIIYTMKLKYIIGDKGSLVKVKGVLGTFRQDIPRERITNIHMNRPLEDKILGLTQIQIQTAGSDKIEMTLNGLAKYEAEEIYKELQKFKKIKGDGV